MKDLYSVPSAPLTIAAGQAACTALNIPANAATGADLLRRAAAEGADLLVLPELFLTGYELRAIASDPAAHVIDPEDSRLDALTAACAETATAVVVSTPTQDPVSGELRISAVVIGRDGLICGRYDKQHPDRAERAAGFTPGVAGCTVNLGGWRLGLGICWDSGFPEHARAAALDGCHAYLISGLFHLGASARRRAMICPVRALDNGSYVVLANHSGPSGPYHGCGHSAVWSPDGSVLADAGPDGPALAVARLEPKSLAEARAGDFPPADPSLAATSSDRFEATAG